MNQHIQEKAGILQTQFSNYFFYPKIVVFDYNFSEIAS